MLASIVHIVNGDWASLVQALTEMDVVRPGTNLHRVTLVKLFSICNSSITSLLSKLEPYSFWSIEKLDI